MKGSTELLLMVGLPYAAILVFVVGLLVRLRSRFTISSLSSQVVESRTLPWGSIPLHAGMAVLFVGHLLPVVAPGPWQRLVSRPAALLAVETLGLAAAMICLFGLVVLLVRRAASPAVRSGATAADFVVLLLLIAQVGLGIAVATLHRWGAVWSARTTTPYLASLASLQPEPAYLAGAPLALALHVAVAWLVLAIIPFTRLVHLLALPLGYLVRPPQKVVWTTTRKGGTTEA